MKLTANEIEAANRAEATALLIRAGYRVYRTEADCYGEDLILRSPAGELLAAQLKSRMTVNSNKYGKVGALWMLFPERPLEPGRDRNDRKWFLVRHDQLYQWVKSKHRHTRKWNGEWHSARVPMDLAVFLADSVVPSGTGNKPPRAKSALEKEVQHSEAGELAFQGLRLLETMKP